MKAVCLPRFSVGNGWIRFICYSQSTGKYTLSMPSKEDDVILLLGADLVATVNNNNVHNKYWNRGLCIKITFEDAIVEGITNSKGLWFYTLQGAFQCAFAHLNHSQQKDIVTNLLEYWLKSKETSGSLSKTINISLDSIDFSTESSLQTDFSTTELHSYTEGTTVAASFSERHDSVHMFDVYTVYPTDIALKEEVCETAEVTGENESVGNSSQCLEELSEPKTEQNDIGQTLDFIASTYENINDCEQQESLLSALRTTCRYCQTRPPYPTTNFFPFNVLETYINIITKHLTFGSAEVLSANRHDLMLHAISSWLGNEFLQLKCHVQDVVDEFKQNYITRIDQMPRPRGLVQELFPACMVILLERWMGIGVGRVGQEYGLVNPLEEVGRTTYSYTIILLILEFMNKTLILAMSHSLYTKLIQTPD